MFFIKYVVIDECRKYLHIAYFYFTMDIVLIDVFETYRWLFKKKTKLSHFLTKKNNIKHADYFSFKSYLPSYLTWCCVLSLHET